MIKLLHQLLSTFSLVSRIPVVLRDKPDFSRSSLFLPPIGLLAGLSALAGAWLGLLLFGPGMLAALSSIIVQYAAFNLFHFDGLLDTADASGVHGSQEKRRAVLKDSRIGVFAFFAGFMVLAARLAVLTQLSQAAAVWLWIVLLLAPVAGRLAGVLAAASGEPAPGSSLATMIGRLSPRQAAVGYGIAVIPAFLLITIHFGIPAGMALVLAGGIAATLSGLLLSLWYRRKIGGYNGDAIGAAIEGGELLVLLLAALILR
ncbi:MAG: adenosylcobinamide-GDP ribazoletransferase [Spirochaetes bacterium]|nr:adenosylcobinamide-GDP ribazoletransferase [Spirochaetota bacterium]